VDEASEDDGVIYAYHNESYIPVDRHPDPFQYRKVGKFIPRHITPRITTQGGLFTIHPDPYEPFASTDMEKIILPANLQTEFKRTLNRYGVNQFALFPGLDGLAAHIQWLQSRKD
jgi:hypothetical protein